MTLPLAQYINGEIFLGFFHLRLLHSFHRPSPQPVTSDLMVVISFFSPLTIVVVPHVEDMSQLVGRRRGHFPQRRSAVLGEAY